jgi:hypothetical protein
MPPISARMTNVRARPNVTERALRIRRIRRSTKGIFFPGRMRLSGIRSEFNLRADSPCLGRSMRAGTPRRRREQSRYASARTANLNSLATPGSRTTLTVDPPGRPGGLPRCWRSLAASPAEKTKDPRFTGVSHDLACRDRTGDLRLAKPREWRNGQGWPRTGPTENPYGSNAWRRVNSKSGRSRFGRIADVLAFFWRHDFV